MIGLDLSSKVETGFAKIRVCIKIRVCMKITVCQETRVYMKPE
jgi:hypothetical protein